MVFRIDRLLTLYFFNFFGTKFRLENNLKIPILMYHSITEDPESGLSPYYHVTTPPALFREQMRFLYDQNYSVIDLPEALRRLSTKTQKLEHCVVLTFDDGFQDFLTKAWPILSDFGFTATVFLPTDFISEIRRSFKGRECLTWTEVRELHNKGVSFGSHTATHSLIYGMPWKDVCNEMIESRMRMEDELQTPVTYFSYPYAFPQEDHNFVVRLKQELINQGYHGAVTTKIGLVRPRSDPYCLERLPVNQGDDANFFKAKLQGAYDWLSHLQLMVRRVKLSIRNGGVKNI